MMPRATNVLTIVFLLVATIFAFYAMPRLRTKTAVNALMFRLDVAHHSIPPQFAYAYTVEGTHLGDGALEIHYHCTSAGAQAERSLVREILTLRGNWPEDVARVMAITEWTDWSRSPMGRPVGGPIARVKLGAGATAVAGDLALESEAEWLELGNDLALLADRKGLPAFVFITSSSAGRTDFVVGHHDVERLGYVKVLHDRELVKEERLPLEDYRQIRKLMRALIFEGVRIDVDITQPRGLGYYVDRGDGKLYSWEESVFKGGVSAQQLADAVQTLQTRLQPPSLPVWLASNDSVGGATQ